MWLVKRFNFNTHFSDASYPYGDNTKQATLKA